MAQSLIGGNPQHWTVPDAPVWIGHHSIKVTVDIDGHLVPGASKAAAGRLDAASRTPRATGQTNGATGSSRNPACPNGGAEGDRTPDPETASLVLSQLSYSPVGFDGTVRLRVLSRRGG